jgi:GT2 family glycosyltransferase
LDQALHSAGTIVTAGDDMAVDLSIIVVTYNGLDITLKTLEAYEKACSADQRHRYEIIVVDNASQDGVDDAVAEKYPQVRLIRNSENLGFSKASNIGFEASEGRYCLFSNADIEVTEETLPTLIALMDESSHVGACTPFLRLVTTGGIDWGAHRGFPTPWAAFTYFARLARLFQGSRQLSKVFGQYHLLDRDLTVPHEVDVIRGGFFFVRRDVFVLARKWDEDYFMFGEDIDLCYQIKKMGYRIMFYPQATALHYHGVTTGLKSYSQGLSYIDPEVKKKVYHSFFDTMKLFYTKNYETEYSGLVRWLVFLAIELKRKLGSKHSIV